MTEEEALHSADRCLDCGVCSECQECVDACPADAIKLDMRGEDDRKSRSAPSSWPPASSSSRPTPSPSTATARTRTSSPACRWTACSRPPGPTTPSCGPATARCPTTSPTSLHGLARRDRRQPPVLPDLLHVLHQAEPAHHGRPAPGRRDRLLHRHARRRQGLRRVLRAGQGHGRRLRQGPGGQDHRDGERRPDPALRGHRERRRAGRGRARPGRARGRRAAQPRRLALFLEGEPLALDEYCYVGESRTRTSTRAAPTSPACSSPARRRASRTSRTRSSTPAPRWPRPRPTSRGESEEAVHER